MLLRVNAGEMGLGAYHIRYPEGRSLLASVVFTVGGY